VRASLSTPSGFPPAGLKGEGPGSFLLEYNPQYRGCLTPLVRSFFMHFPLESRPLLVNIPLRRPGLAAAVEAETAYRSRHAL